MTLKESLIENNSILVQQEASDWKTAIKLAINPLIASGAVEERYYDEIVKNTEELGPYYILSPGIAMPHARPEGGVNRNCFGLTVLKEPIKFGKEEHEYAQILITLAATSSDIHAEEAIPQIVMLFDDEANFDKLVNATTVEEVLEIL
jgi:PTS system ascorbate-specific IIA component